MNQKVEQEAPNAGEDVPLAPRDRRRYQRHTTIMQGRLFFAETRAEGIILDISINGVKMRVDTLLPLGAPVTLAIAGSVYIGGEVIWRQGNVLGVTFAKAPEHLAHLMAAFLPVACLHQEAHA